MLRGRQGERKRVLNTTAGSPPSLFSCSQSSLDLQMQNLNRHRSETASLSSVSASDRKMNEGTGVSGGGGFPTSGLPLWVGGGKQDG